MTSIFTKIINREIPAHIVWEDEAHVAFLDHMPTQPGHLLLVPKKEIGSVFDMEDSEYQAIFAKAKFLAKPLQNVTGAERIGLLIAGLEVNHVHIHLIPINNVKDLDFTQKANVTPEEIAEMAEKIKAALQN